MSKLALSVPRISETTDCRPSSIPDPGTILITPLGNPALAANSANFSAVIEVTWKKKSASCQINFDGITQMKVLEICNIYEIPQV